MTRVITSLCMRDNGCTGVCPVECVQPGSPIEQWPTYYIDAATCIGCGAWVRECSFAAIFQEDEVPAAYEAADGEYINRAGLKGHYEDVGHRGQRIVLEAGEVLDLRKEIARNREFMLDH